MSLSACLGKILYGLSDSEKMVFVSSIYSDTYIVKAVFGQLSDLEKVFVSRMLLLDRSIKESLFIHWCTLPGQSVSLAIKNLLQISVLIEIPGGDRSFDLFPSFRASLVSHILDEKIESSLTSMENGKFFFQNSVPTVITSKISKWHSLLERIISSPTMMVSTSERDIDRIISTLGFGAYPPPHSAYRFVLSDTSAQIWLLIVEFLKVLERSSMIGGSSSIFTVSGTSNSSTSGGLENVAIALKIIIGIGMINCGTSMIQIKTCPISNRTISFLEDLDIVSQRAGSYTLGPLAGAIMGGTVGGNGLTDLLTGAQLIVDSNMHITAYTQSSLQSKLVSFFCSVQRMLCGVFLVGVLTRQSVQRAVEAGVGSETIIKFLSSNLHPSISGGLPQNVINQIKLWESDFPRNRLRLEPVIVFSWRSENRSEQVSRSVDAIRHKVDPYGGFVFLKVDEAAGKIHLGIKADIAKEYILRSTPRV
jgi:transcription initiation factor TFIIH subunit 4